MNSKERGDRAEGLARDYLQSKGLKFVEKNFRGYRGEIDLIFLQDQQIIFVEVRSLRSQESGLALESIAAQKQAKIQRTAEQYLKARRMHQLQPRFDVVIVSQNQPDTTPKIEHWEAAF